jgi:hypothetical protein
MNTLCLKFRGAHASRVLTKPTRLRKVFWMQQFQQEAFGESPKAARESRALPREI